MRDCPICGAGLWHAWNCSLNQPTPRDSDGSGEADKTGTGLAEGDSAGLKGIAQPQSPSSHKNENRGEGE
jgi:hypothetical protein